MKTVLLYCAYADVTVHSSQGVSSPLLKNITNMPPPWARSLFIYERCSLLFPPTLHADFAKHPKIRNKKAENGSIFGRENNMTPNFEVYLTKTHKRDLDA